MKYKVFRDVDIGGLGQGEDIAKEVGEWVSAQPSRRYVVQWFHDVVLNSSGMLNYVLTCICAETSTGADP